jgi:GDPmannose 4,6-dehydratase
MKKNFLITGAKGQDGLILSDVLIKKGYKVFGLIKKKKYSNFVEKVKYLQSNLSNKKQVLKLLIDIKPDVIIHFGSTNPSFDERSKKNFFYNRNFLETKNLIDASLFTKRKISFLFANSAQIIKKSKKKKLNEKSNLYDYNDYTKFRYGVLKYLKNIKKNNHFKFINLILFNHDSKFRNSKFLIPRIIKYIKNKDFGSLNEIYSQNISGDFSHAEDICNAIYLLIKKNKNIDNLILSSGKKTKINDIIKLLMKLSGLNYKFPLPKKSLNMSLGDNRLAKKILRWKIKKNIYLAVKEIYKN